MLEKIKKIKNEAIVNILKTDSIAELENLRINYLGKKSEFNQILKGLKDLNEEEKKAVGPEANKAKKDIQDALEKRIDDLEEMVDTEKEWIDVTAPGKKIKRGHLHPITIVQRDIEDIFTSMGFEIADGPEVESEFYNFDAVNVPEEHPGRDMQDTFWISKEEGREKGTGTVLRTQTSSVQVRYMQTHKPPFRIIIPGRVFRQEATDASHEHTFHQFEALVVGKKVSVANFLYIAETFFSQFFGKKLNVRLRPSYFPFVEPGFEFDISCTNCGGKGCSSCKQTGWLEVGGAGMVHQNVFEAAGYEKGKYQGFAWGFGLERLAMMKYKIDDIRHFHGGDVRFTRQF
ncbi:MAG: Phenylalanine-tRNA ligase alpha subunit [Candidatus Moranbacteria bacterium GW2011_GWF2_34_56]|nr:MAG: Phenylalanine-tRNA ligase alpha subunit [Candidatus Moranbacteria bacterium GW2011_GWF1_34_10]KKP65065.1 MAG: Phenylalanine-tRNA ligase alpha subunit [Candidatus Moranbacteria bacterium GW2011_GWF2_34_56]HBI16653.1 phenylalanine--tRNA ligase subunit alpha [Candidatus Moranbacteria bacterium]